MPTLRDAYTNLPTAGKEEESGWNVINDSPYTFQDEYGYQGGKTRFVDLTQPEPAAGYAPYQDDWGQTPTPAPSAPSSGVNTGQWGQPANSPQTGPANSPANYPSLISSMTPYGSTQAQQPGGVSGGGITVAPRTPIGAVRTTKTTYQGKAPTFAAPEWDEKEIRKKSRKLAGPALAAMEQEVQRAVGQYYENPNVRRMVLRDTLQGYGIGMANVLLAAERGATAEYGAEYGRTYQTAMVNYQSAWQQYMSTAQQVTSEQEYYTTAGITEAMKPGVK